MNENDTKEVVVFEQEESAARQGKRSKPGQIRLDLVDCDWKCGCYFTFSKKPGMFCFKEFNFKDILLTAL